MVSELWFAAAAAIEHGQIRGLTTDIIREGTMREWKEVEKGKYQVEPKSGTKNRPGMKQRLGESPDLFDMFVCAIEGARRLGMAIGKHSVAQVVTPRWLEDASDRFREIHQRHQLAYN
jgi:hypothetical protein